MEVRVIGIDIAKRYFQIHGVDVAGDVVLRRKLSRDAFLKLIRSLSPCVIGMEAGSGAHLGRDRLHSLATSAASFLFVFTYGRTNCGGIRRMSWPSCAICRAQ